MYSNGCQVNPGLLPQADSQKKGDPDPDDAGMLGVDGPEDRIIFGRHGHVPQWHIFHQLIPADGGHAEQPLLGNMGKSSGISLIQCCLAGRLCMLHP